MCWIDCGKTFEVNAAWFAALSPWFVPDRTLVIMQDWQAHRTPTTRRRTASAPSRTRSRACTSCTSCSREGRRCSFYR
jgi:hypothetical protein